LVLAGAAPSDVSCRVDLPSVLENLKVNVRSGRTTTTAHPTDDLAFPDHVSCRYCQLLVMTIAGHVTTTMVDLDHFSIAIPVAGKDHNARGNRHNIGSLIAGEIDACMPCYPTGYRIDAAAEG
jgi:hypothetical protein